ncbi:thymidine phosphorylase [Sphingomonas cavernae]|uniref:Thymidine phosphorylase n=1 Tax=Sphingomonas cavernae TaxID=2320861 RepID=A0A418W6I4_9SPHN|nr:thymidine phosphorylase [Sphingomonas cavernae]RJF85578.1 thymidine phosphorylase [Sphingomonas cavernae]
MPTAPNMAEIIRRKRDGEALCAQEISHFATGLADQSIPAEQAAALAMAIFLNGMDIAETAALTSAFVGSGRVIDWRETIDGPVLDKHSTGGVGDKVSLMLAPIVAACGGYVPMISGRGLGHTGGTLDKMASIPGYDPFPGLDRFRNIVQQNGCAIIGQTGELAPADRRMYAIRDITATIESFPLITASILSKKVAAGVRGLVMDIKTGSGAFMARTEQAHALARSLIGSAEALGVTCHALITDMNQVLGTTAGNALEVREAIDYLTGAACERRLHAVTMALAAEMLVIGGLAQDHADAERRAGAALASGKAAEVFARMVAGLGGPADLIERPDAHLPSAPVSLSVFVQSPGYLAEVDVRAIGDAIINLGGGRRAADDLIDPRTGFSNVVPIGAEIGPDRPLAFVHAADEAAAKRGLAEFLRACIVAPEKPAPGAVVHAIELPHGPGGK